MLQSAADSLRREVEQANKNRDFAMAQRLLNQLMQHDASSDTWHLQFTISFATSDWKGTLRSLLKYERLEGPDFNRSMLTAMLEDELDHPEEARRHLTVAVGLAGLTPLQLSQAVDVADLLDEDEILRSVVDRLLELDPTHRTARRHRAILLERADSSDEALAIIEPMTRDQAASHEDFVTWRFILRRAGRVDEALAVDEVLAERWPAENHTLLLQQAQ